MSPGKFVVLSLISFAGCVTQPSAQSCNPADFSGVQSQIGLDYAALVGSPAAEILAAGEAEYFARAASTFLAIYVPQSDWPQVWQRQVKALVSQELPDVFIDHTTPSAAFFREQTPEMFQRLRNCISPDDPQLGYITGLPKFPEVIELNE
jgi:hypothetical protein